MKKNIHPQYQEVVFSCVCGAKYIAGSTLKDKEIKTEICSACHPFYTGKQKLVDTSGRVDKFMAKVKKAQEVAEKKVKKVEEKKENKTEKVAKKTTAKKKTAKK